MTWKGTFLYFYFVVKQSVAQNCDEYIVHVKLKCHKHELTEMSISCHRIKFKINF